MTDVMALALKYGGFTSLDQVFLANRLAGLAHDEQMAVITPPPSVVNAYFSEIYQKQGPQEAMAYYFELSQAFDWFGKQTSFAKENYPFIRLNLSGKSYGLTFVDANQKAVIFAEDSKSLVTPDLMVEIAQVFPQYKVYQDGQEIFLQMIDFDEEAQEKVALAEESLLTEVARLKGHLLKVTGYSLEEILALVSKLPVNAQEKVYYSFNQRLISIYLHER